MRTTGVIDMATLHLMVGLPCSGKTTRARELEYKCSALRLTPDEWQLRLFGQDAEDPEHNVRHSLMEALLWEIASRALVLGTNVILDYGFLYPGRNDAALDCVLPETDTRRIRTQRINGARRWQMERNHHEHGLI